MRYWNYIVRMTETIIVLSEFLSSSLFTAFGQLLQPTNIILNKWTLTDTYNN